MITHAEDPGTVTKGRTLPDAALATGGRSASGSPGTSRLVKPSMASTEGPAYSSAGSSGAAVTGSKRHAMFVDVSVCPARRSVAGPKGCRCTGLPRLRGHHPRLLLRPLRLRRVLARRAPLRTLHPRRRPRSTPRRRHRPCRCEAGGSPLMPAISNPIVGGRRLGAELRRLRQASGRDAPTVNGHGLRWRIGTPKGPGRGWLGPTCPRLRMLRSKVSCHSWSRSIRGHLPPSGRGEDRYGLPPRCSGNGNFPYQGDLAVDQKCGSSSEPKVYVPAAQWYWVSSFRTAGVEPDLLSVEFCL